MWKRLTDQFFNSRFYRTLRYVSNRIILPGFEGRSLYTIATFFWEGITKGALITRASAISFKIFVAIFPSVILLLSLIPLVPIEGFQEDLLASVISILPADIRPVVASSLEDLITKRHSTVFSIGFVLTLYYASNSINTILTCFNSSYNIQIRRHPVKQRLISLGLVLILSIMLITAVVLVIGSKSIMQWMDSKDMLNSNINLVLYHMGRWIVIVAFFLIVVSILYNIGNQQKSKWRWMSPGALLTTIIFALASVGFAYYVNNFDNYNSLYGSIGTLLVVLIWININSIILLIGFELNATIYRQPKRGNSKALKNVN